MRMSEFYTVSHFAQKIGKHLKTVQAWDRKGIFPARRTPTNRRYYTEEDYQRYLRGEWNTTGEDTR
jgi:putative resolvase